MTASSTVALWITDGSVPVFSDTILLEARHQGPLGLSVRYEGFVDPEVFVATAELDGERPDDALFVEVEWWLSFPEGIGTYLSAPDAVDDETPVRVQAMLEGKWLNRLLGTEAWKPASIANNVIAEGPGLLTTIGGLATCGAAARTEYLSAAGRSREFRTEAADVEGHNVLGLVRDVLHACAAGGVAIDGINLGALGERSAVVNEPKRLRAATRLKPHRAKEALVLRALAERLGVPDGARVDLEATGPRGETIGEATLSWRRAGATPPTRQEDHDA